MFNGFFYVTYLCKGFSEWAQAERLSEHMYIYLPVIQTVTKHLKISEKERLDCFQLIDLNKVWQQKSFVCSPNL